MKIFKKLFSICILALFLSNGYSAEKGEQELIPAGHWVYDCLAAITLESGKASLADTQPLSISQIKTYMDELDYNELSEAGTAEYNRILDFFKSTYFSYDSELMYFGFEPELNLEGYYKTNDDIDWVFDRYSRKGLLESPISFGYSDFILLKMDLAARENKAATTHNDNYTSIPGSVDDIDIDFPRYGYLSTGKKFSENSGIAFKIGLFERNVGRTLMGSCIYSEYITGVTNALLEIYSPNIKYYGSVSEFNVDKYYYQHQIEARFFDKLTFTVLEGLIVNAPMELRYMNPLNIFHGFAPWRDYDSDYEETHTGSLMGLKLQFVPVKGLRLYGLFAMTQFQTPTEIKDNPNDLTPNGLCGQLGTEYYKAVNEGFLHLGLEGYYAQPYMYIKESPDWTFVRTYKGNNGDRKNFYEWIGSPYGPDTISSQLKIGYEVPSKWSVELIELFMARGEMSGTQVFDRLYEKTKWGGSHINEFDYDNKDSLNAWCYPTKDNGAQENGEGKRRQKLITPSGTPEYVNRVSLRGKYIFSKKLDATVQPSYVFIMNKNHVENKKAHGFEIAASLNYKF